LSEPGATPPTHSANSSAAYRGALAAVIFLGVLIVIAVGVLVVGLVSRFAGGGRKPAEPAFAQFTLAPGNRLVSSDVSGDRLVLRLRGPAGDEIDIIDTENGRLIAKIASAAPPKK
jgi:hypothetical protein